MSNSIYLSLVIRFRDEDVKDEDHNEIAQNVLNVLTREIKQGGDITPNGAEYLTEYIQITNAIVKKSTTLF